jgi:uncharacterized membrane protein (UPF0182 family)
VARLGVVAGVIAVLVALALIGMASGLFVDALWFRQLGVLVVFRTILVAKLACFALAFAACYAVVGGFGLAAVRHVRSPGRVRVMFPQTGNGPTTLPELLAPIVHRIPWRALVLAAAALLSLPVALAQMGSWQTYLLWFRGGTFGVADPHFGRDVGFFVFTLPAYRALIGGAMAAVVLAGLLAAAVFRLQGALDFRRAGDVMSPSARTELSLLLALFLLVKAAGYWVGRYELLLEPYGAVFGAGYTVAHAKVPFQLILVAVALVGAGLAAANLRVQGWRLPVAAVVLLAGTAIASSILPDVVQRLRVRPDELRLEAPYLERNIAMTRRAYGLDAIQPRPFPAAQTLDAAAVARNQATFANIRLWDPQPLLDTYRQLQLIRLYYEFHDVDVDRYEVGGESRQVMLAAREIAPSLLPPNARTWVNRRLQFTHGFGVVMSPVTELEGEGLPRFLLKDIPPRSPAGLELGEPRIYFGEKTDDYVVVKAAAEEFDYPKGEQNVSNTYAGGGGVELGSWLRRAIFAWRFGDVNLLISGNLSAESRILFRRSIAERISTIAPFLRLDHDPYVVVSGGRLYWIQDAYTTAATFPYSEPIQGSGFNYIRNSAKVAVDAYDGTVTFYAVDDDEPMLAAYARIFPGLFHPLAEMPADLRRHVRDPEDLFVVQAEIYRTSHMTKPDVFYNKEDLWSFPTEETGGRRGVVEPYYVIMKLPGGAREEFILMQPMTPANRSNMVAWLAARSDPPAYGELVEYQFPKERLIYGPQQIEARIDQDTTISQQLSLWNQMGSKVIRGNLLVIPVEDSLVYVEPLYLRSEQGQIPELKRVVVAYNDRLAMEPRLEAALAAVFGPGAAPPPAAVERPPTAAAPATVVAETARAHYRAALDALRAGDWSGFGREMEALGKSLEE